MIGIEQGIKYFFSSCGYYSCQIGLVLEREAKVLIDNGMISWE